RPTPAVPLDPSPGTRQGIINEKGISHARNLCLRSLRQAPTDGEAIDRGRSRARSRRVAFLRGVLSSPHSTDIGQGRRGMSSFFTLSKRKGLPHLSGSRPRDRRFHVERKTNNQSLAAGASTRH